MRLSGLRSLCLSTASISAAAMFEPRALHDEGHVLVGRALERDQRVRRLRLVVERHQLELLAERAALGIDVVDDVLELLQVRVADLGERTRERIGVGDLDRALGLGEVDAGREAERQRECDGTPREPVEHGPSCWGRQAPGGRAGAP